MRLGISGCLCVFVLFLRLYSFDILFVYEPVVLCDLYCYFVFESYRFQMFDNVLTQIVCSCYVHSVYFSSSMYYTPFIVFMSAPYPTHESWHIKVNVNGLNGFVASAIKRSHIFNFISKEKFDYLLTRDAFK